MKKTISVLLTSIMVMLLVGCGGNSKKHEGEAKTPSGSSTQKGKIYSDVVNDFKSKGFNNIKTEKIEDLITGWITKDGEVKEVSVGGDVNYSSDKWVAANTEVIVKYHTFKEENTESVKESEKKNDSDTKKSTEESEKKDDSNEKKATKEPEKKDDSNKKEATEEILTVDNCAELAQIINIKYEFDPSIKEFAKKYAGRTIEFDGNIANLQKHGSYKTRFDYLISTGDYSTTTASGPLFQFSDVNSYDLHLTGDNIPDTLGEGLNIHVTAIVGEYNETSGLFQLKPVSIKMR